MDIRTFRNGAHRENSALRERLAAIVAPSYDGECRALDVDWHRADLLYLLADGDTEVAFFFVTTTTLLIEGESTRAFYLGLSATSERTKNSGQVRRVFDTFLADAAMRDAEAGSPAWCFGYTATPSSVDAVLRLWSETQPRRDGSFDLRRVGVALAAGKWLGATHDPSHPFVLPRLSAGTRYSDLERSRIDALVSKTGFDLFTRLGIDERRGDRLLLTARAPRHGQLRSDLSLP